MRILYPSNPRRGFTLIELLVVLGIIGILAAIVLVAINPSKQLSDAKNAARKTQIREQENALMQYLISEGQTPTGIPTSEALAKPVCRTGESDPSCFDLSILTPEYLVSLPLDGSSTDALVTGYRIYLDNAYRPRLCSDYLSTGEEKRCSASTAPDEDEGSSGGSGGSTGGTTGGDIACAGTLPFEAGDGTIGDPYQMCSCAQLQNLNGTASYFELTSDVDCSETAEWNEGLGFAPIAMFAGTLDGNDHTISNLTIHRPSTAYIGLINQLMVGGTVENIHLRDIDYVGGARTGGLVAFIYGGAVTNSSVTGDISTSSDAGYVGGLAGLMLQSTSSVSKSWTDVDINSVVTFLGNGGIGGLVGSMNMNATVDNSYALGDITSVGGPGGGISGYTEGGATIQNSYSAGAVSTNTAWTYGFSPGSSAGSTGNYYDTQTSGRSDTNLATPKTTVQMRQEATFSGWDFDTIWEINEGSGYPTLRQ